MEIPKNPVSNQDEIWLQIRDSEISREFCKKTKPTSLAKIYHDMNEWVIEKSPIPLGEKLIFFESLGAMINAGVAVPEALHLIGKQTKNEKMKRVIRDLKNLVESGESLSGAMKRNEDIFDEVACSIVESGERSGKLNDVLKELIHQYERLYDIRHRVQSVMIYPIIVVITMILLSIVVMIFVIPKLAVLFEGAENLPLPTRILVGISNFTVDHLSIVLGGMVAIPAGFIWWKHTASGHRAWNRFVLKLPGIGQLVQSMILSRLTRVFGFLVSSGIPIIDGLKIAARVSDSPVYEEKLLLTADDLSRGISIAENLADNERYFPTMLVNMIAVGERTASLETVMKKVAQFYDESLDRKVANLSKLMEPLLLFIIASGAIFMILAIFLPILKMNEQIMG